MKISDLLKKADKQLAKKNITSAVLDAEVLLSFVLKKPREFLWINPEQKLTRNQFKRFNHLMERRLKLEPIAYLTKKKEFYGFDFYVDKRVLIPRPETEILVEKILKTTKDSSKITIADIGTGSGCIAISLAKHLPEAKIIATDISQNALEVAKRNAKKHRVFKRIKFFAGDLLKPLFQPVDLIIANLPYLPKKETNKELKYEPTRALIGKKSGREYLEKLLKQAPQKLKPKGKIFLEIHPPQWKLIKAAALSNFPKAKIEIIKDLANRERLMIISL